MPNNTTIKKRRKIAFLLGLGLLAIPCAAYGLEALNVDVPLMPAVGESNAGTCDTNGVTTSYAYGNTSSNGIRVNSVTVAGIDASCTNLTVAFMNGDTTVSSHSGAVSAGSATLAVTVWTYQFTSVRVALFP